MYYYFSITIVKIPAAVGERKIYIDEIFVNVQAGISYKQGLLTTIATAH